MTHLAPSSGRTWTPRFKQAKIISLGGKTKLTSGEKLPKGQLTLARNYLALRGVFSSGTWPLGAAPAFYSAWCRGKHLFSPQGTETDKERKKKSHFVFFHFLFFFFLLFPFSFFFSFFTDYFREAGPSPSVLLLQPSQWWNVLRLCWVHRSAEHICHSCQLGEGKKQKTKRRGGCRDDLMRLDWRQLKRLSQAVGK